MTEDTEGAAGASPLGAVANGALSKPALDLPRISVITPSFNQVAFLEETLRSVLDQGYPDLELIVVDGGSTDGSLGILHRYADELAYWCSEPDGGQTEAINKGLTRATGDLVSYLNSDDLFLPGALEAVGTHFVAHPECRWLCAEGVEFGHGVGAPRRVPRRIPRDAAEAAFFNYRMVQPANFWRREVFAEYGGFDTRFSYCFDHEFYVRLLVGGEVCEPLDLEMTAFRFHPESKTVSQWPFFLPEIDLIRERYLGDLLPRRVLEERALWAWRESGFALATAEAEWVAGRREGALEAGVRALQLSPVAVAVYLSRRLKRIVGQRLRRD